MSRHDDSRTISDRVAGKRLAAAQQFRAAFNSMLASQASNIRTLEPDTIVYFSLLWLRNHYGGPVYRRAISAVEQRREPMEDNGGKMDARRARAGVPRGRRREQD